MKLVRFGVFGFRSVQDSGVIDTDDVTALVGTNESGKTNLLLPLWKLNPAKEGAISPTADYPRKHYTPMRAMKPKPVFVRAVFADEELAGKLAALTGLPAEQLREVQVTKDFDNEIRISFPHAHARRSIPRNQLITLVQMAHEELKSLEALKSEAEWKDRLLGAVVDLVPAGADGHVPVEDVERMVSAMDELAPDEPPKTSVLVPRATRLREDLAAVDEELSRPEPEEVDGVVGLVLERLPSFVYYSNYGNLDSEIYLPQVIENLRRQDLGTKESAKARTLRVLFQFVGLSPKEILELGRDFKDPSNPSRKPTDQEIAEITEKKKQRSILLQSASAQLTEKFRKWWKQGDYRFRFEADGDHFRIWVSDDRRPEEVELENRSTGLQWFLSFYLVFLVESEGDHAGAILLLDEPGMSLHPLAQKDLSVFFDGLAVTNQLLYTTHSPFLVDADRLERARKVYVSEDGTTKATADLRAGDGGESQKGASYAVLAALGLTVADSLLIGCTPVIVEGLSDQHYLGAMKNLLIASGRFKPSRELIFPPAGGAKTVKAVVSVLGARDEEMPIALFDSDEIGRKLSKDLRTSLYQAVPGRVLDVATFAANLEGAEVEDLLPADLIVQQVDRWQRGPEEVFADFYRPGKPIVPQIEAWAKKHNIVLASPGWKVDLAKRVKQILLQRGAEAVDGATLDQWALLFRAFTEAARDTDTDVGKSSTPSRPAAKSVQEAQGIAMPDAATSRLASHR